MSDAEARLRAMREELLQVETELADALIALRREKRTRRKAVARAQKARNDARFLHGILLLHEIEIPERAA